MKNKRKLQNLLTSGRLVTTFALYKSFILCTCTKSS